MTEFEFKYVSAFFNWEGRPAVTVEPPEGELSGWFIRASSDPGEWETISPLEIRDSGRPLSKASFQEVFANRLASKKVSPEVFALVEEGTSRAWLFLDDKGDAPLRGLDGTWSNEEVVMADELADFRIASSSELSALIQEAAASLRDSPSLSKAAEKASS